MTIPFDLNQTNRFLVVCFLMKTRKLISWPGQVRDFLSIWGIKAGAKKVYALEKTDAVHLAKEIARANHCSDQIEFVHGNSKEIELPEKADVLISETLMS